VPQILVKEADHRQTQMSQRSKTVELLSEYFEEKGDILTPHQYKKEKDTPIRLEQVKRVFGNWSRMEKIVRAFDARNKNKPAPFTNASEVIGEQNRLAAEHEALIRSIGEDVEQKTAREEAARAQIEADALNAATPEGARENKVRKGGPESVDAKTIKESLARAVANEHAMLAKTPEGAALGKELLGGVEDQDAKNLAIARQNARTERSALLAATPEGSALAKMEEDDSDGKLTREAERRLKAELRPYVEPATEEAISAAVKEAKEKVRDDTQEVVDVLADTENLSVGAAVRGDLGFADGPQTTIVTTTEDGLEKAPPADRIPDPAVADPTAKDAEETGIDPKSFKDLGKTEESADAKTEAPKTSLKTSPTAKENKESVNLEQNKENPEAPPADRNPDPKFNAVTVEGEDDAEEKVPTKEAEAVASDKAARKPGDVAKAKALGAKSPAGK
jgi:hypothetical protein